MTQEQWLENILASVRRKLNMAINDMGMSYSDARDYVEVRSTAGNKVWEIIDMEFKNEQRKV